MSERKVLNKYYPPDFDPSKIPRLHLPKDRQYTVRLMAPCNMKCKTCGEYIYKGKKFNARKETVQGEDYLGLKIFRFYIKCTRCLAEITFKTDPQNADYIVEHGATRNFQALKLAEEQAEREQRDREEEEASNPMKLLENRTKASKLEMDVMESLEELRELQERHANIDYEKMLTRHADHAEMLKKRQEDEDEAVIRSIFGKDESDVVIRRILDEDEDSDDDALRIRLKDEAKSMPENPSDVLTNALESVSNSQTKSWDKSVGSLTSKSALAGLVRLKCKKDGSSTQSEMPNSSQRLDVLSAVKEQQTTSECSVPTALSMIGTYSESSGDETDS